MHKSLPGSDEVSGAFVTLEGERYYCTSAKDMAPIGLFSKRHFSAGCFSSLAC
jgi:hypothetical protein